MRGKRARGRMKTANRVLILLGAFLLIFIVTMVVTFWAKGAVPDTLISCVLDAGRWEAALLAAITVCKHVAGDKPGKNVSDSDTEI